VPIIRVSDVRLNDNRTSWYFTGSKKNAISCETLHDMEEGMPVVGVMPTFPGAGKWSLGALKLPPMPPPKMPPPSIPPPSLLGNE